MLGVGLDDCRVRGGKIKKLKLIQRGENGLQSMRGELVGDLGSVPPGEPKQDSI